MPRTSHIDGLTGLRAFAALAVFGVHFNQTVRMKADFGPFDLSRLLANGEHGVALFFALSGFLLSLPFWRSLDRGTRPDLRVYAVRRLARILPAYYAALTLLVIAGGLWWFPPAWPDIALHYGFLFNFTEFSIFSINAPFWTLAVEVQFYVLLPLVFLLLAKVHPRVRPAFLVALAVGAYGLHYGLISNVSRLVDWPLDPRLTWIRPYGAVLSHSLLAHLPHFLLGVIGASLFLHREDSARLPRSAWRNEALFWSTLVLVLLFTGTALQDAVQIPYGRYGLPLVPLLLTVMIVAAPATRLARACLTARPVHALGTVSYGFYIYHVPCLVLVDRLMMDRGLDAAEHGTAFGLVGFALTVLAAMTSYVVIERPVLRAAHRFA